MSILILDKETAGISYKQLTSLLHDSFKERLEQGLNFTCSSLTEKQLEQKTKDGQILCAIDNDNGELLGSVTLTILKDKKGLTYGYHEYLAVSPKKKRLGIATKLFNELKKKALNNKCNYLISDTACKANSSVDWHLKNGFQIFELESYRSTNYWSYVFIQPLTSSFKLSKFTVLCHYIKSYLFIKLTRNIDGTDTVLGKIYKKIR